MTWRETCAWVDFANCNGTQSQGRGPPGTKAWVLHECKEQKTPFVHLRFIPQGLRHMAADIERPNTTPEMGCVGRPDLRNWFRNLHLHLRKQKKLRELPSEIGWALRPAAAAMRSSHTKLANKTNRVKNKQLQRAQCTFTDLSKKSSLKKASKSQTARAGLFTVNAYSSTRMLKVAQG